MHIGNIQTDVLVGRVPGDVHRTALVVHLGDLVGIREDPSEFGWQWVSGEVRVALSIRGCLHHLTVCSPAA